MFKEAADKFWNKFELGKVYYISKGTLRVVNKQFKTVANDYEMTLHANSEVEEAVEEGTHIPEFKYNFVKVDELGPYVNSRDLVDVIGVVQSVSPVLSIRVYIMVVKASDSRGEAWLSVFSDQAEQILRHTADELAVIRSEETMAQRPVDPEEELRLMVQEVRGYVEAVLNSLAANVPKAVVLCQVEKAKDEMLTQLYSSVSAHSTPRIEELLQEDQNAKRKRERYQKQASLLAKLTRQLSVHDTRASSDNWSANGGSGSAASMPVSINEDWRVAFDSAANGPSDYSNSVADSPRISSSSNNGHSRRLSDPGQNGDMNSSRRTPNRLPPPPPGSSVYRY